MDKNMSDDDSRKITLGSPTENPKRLKTDNGTLENEEASSSPNNTEQESASTSTDSGVDRKTSRSRIRITNENMNDTENIGSGDDDSSRFLSGEDEDSLMRDDSVDSANLRSSSSDDTVIHDTDTDSEGELPEVLKKETPKHNWFVIPEILNRQIGYNAKHQSPELFQMRCYGSLRNVQRLELMYKLEEHDGCVNSLNFHPTGDLLASGSDDLKVAIWDWKNGKCVLKFDTKHRGNVFQSKFLNLSGDLHIATCARDGQVRIAQVSKEEGLRDNRKLGAHRGPCHKLTLLNEQPHVILSAGEDGLVLSHDVRKNRPDKVVNVKEDDREVALYSIHGNPLRTNEFCVSGRDDMVRIYDQRKSNSPLSIHYPFKRNQTNDYGNLHVTCAVYNYNGSEILASYNDSDIFLFDVNAPPGQFIHQYAGHRNGATIKGVSFFGPRSEFIVSGSDCGHIYFWEKNSEAIVNFILADDNGVVNCLEPHPQLPYICTSGLDWDVKVWVPSKEEDPKMPKLTETVRSNIRSQNNWSASADVNESQMLWMLWRHLRSTNRMRVRVGRVAETAPENILFQVNTNSSSSGSSSNSLVSSNEDDDDENIDGPTGCSAS